MSNEDAREPLSEHDVLPLRPSPEVDLLEMLTGRDESLDTVLAVFGSPTDPVALEHARRVVSIYATNGIVEIVRLENGVRSVLPHWEIRPVLTDPLNWTDASESGPAYLLCLTPKGYDTFVEDSASFFARLFADRPKRDHWSGNVRRRKKD